MTCPDCQGGGRIRKRFLIVFTRNARCRKCLGTGRYPPAVRPQVRVTRSSGTRDRDDDRWPPPTFGSASSTQSDRGGFEVGSGGRSGGGGATASWDAPGEAPPVIADPFSGESSPAVSSAIAADAADSSSGADSSSSGSASPDGGGTSY